MKKETMSGNGFLQALILWMVIQDLQVLQVLKLIEGLVDEMTGSEVAECEVTTWEGTEGLFVKTLLEEGFLVGLFVSVNKLWI